VEEYAPEAVRQGLETVLSHLGGMGAFVSKGDRVLLKPNFLMSKPVESAVSTHPEVILAVAEAAFAAGAGEVWVGDSPGFHSAKAVARKLGLEASLQSLGAKLLNFKSPVEVAAPESVRYKRFEVDRSVMEADKVINLVKVKTHAQMFMTLAIKNTFGYVVGTRKAAWHLEAGRDEDLFATMLLDLHYLRAPVLNIADGIVMMEGNGPGAGTPRLLGLLFAGADGDAVDRIICDVLSVKWQHVPSLRVADRLGLHDPASVTLRGAVMDDIRIKGIVHPLLSRVGDFLTPRPLLPLTRRLVEVRPVVNKRACIGCGLCAKQCPADSISMADDRKGGAVASIHRKLCIHCYCCQEICPEGAIGPRRGLIRSLLRRPGSHQP